MYCNIALFGNGNKQYSLRGAGYQGILFHLVMQKAGKGLKKGGEVVFPLLVKLGTLSVMTAKDHV